MISHKYKCIYIHIPRTAGTSIEKWIVGDDWWNIDKNTKHLTAHQAKKLYKKYWKNYYKFSFVRNPWDRVISLLSFSDHFGIDYKNGQLSFEGYKKKFGFPYIVEFDHRIFSTKEAYPKRKVKNAVYKNILGEELDFIGKFENLKHDTDFLQKKLGIEKKFNINQKTAETTSKYNIIGKPKRLQDLIHTTKEVLKIPDIKLKKNTPKKYRKYYDKDSIQVVRDMYKKDIDKFGYTF